MKEDSLIPAATEGQTMWPNTKGSIRSLDGHTGVFESDASVPGHLELC